MTSTAGHRCAWCREAIPAGLRRDARHCSQRCRQAAHRFARRRASGFVYAVQAVEGRKLVKFGFTRGDPEKRLRHLQTGSPVELRLLCAVPGWPADETRLQRGFAEIRVRGEWFEPSPELLALVARMVDGTAALALPGAA